MMRVRIPFKSSFLVDFSSVSQFTKYSVLVLLFFFSFCCNLSLYCNGIHKKVKSMVRLICIYLILFKYLFTYLSFVHLFT